MKLGIDARPLQGETRFRGIGKTLENILEAFSKISSIDIEYVFYIDPSHPIPAILKLFPNSKHIHINSPAVNRKRYIRALLPIFPKIKPSKKDIDILIQYDAYLGIPKNVPTIAVFYDLIPYLFKDTERKTQKPHGTMKKLKHGAGKRIQWWKYVSMLEQYQNAAHIISISEASKRDLLSYMPNISANKVTPVLLGVSPIHAPTKVRTEIASLAKKPYMLYVGGIDVRKNIIGLLRSFFEVKVSHPEIKLLAVGKEFELKGHLEDLGWSKLLNENPDLAKDVLTPGFISDDELRYLYKNAVVFVFPSRYEGFGLPILEAMQQGCPVITYRNSSLIEVAGDAAVLVDDGKSIVKPLTELLDNKSMRERLGLKGQEHVKDFTWGKTAQSTLEIIRRAFENAD